MTKAPKEITPALLDVIVMPNGEVICYGKSIGWVKELGRFLTPKGQEKRSIDRGTT